MQKRFFFLKNAFLRTKFDLQLPKNKKNRGNFKITWKSFCVAIKKMPVIQFPYMGVV